MFGISTDAWLQVLESRVVQQSATPPEELHRRYMGTGGSWQEYEGALIAYIASNEIHAEKARSLIWDPPNANYVGRRSEVCTTEQQRVAFGFRDLGTTAIESSRSELKRISMLWRANNFPKEIAYQAGAVGAIAEKDATTFLEQLRLILSLHKAIAELESNRFDRHRFLCLPGLGLAAFALFDGLVIATQLPRGDVYFPVDLIRASA